MTSDEQVEQIVESAGGNSPVFATTHWSVVLAAGQERDSSQATEALEKLCRTYWYPLYAFVRRRGYGPEDAQDLTQDFFAQLLRKNYPARADRVKGKFRTFLLHTLNQFLADQRERAMTLKRGGGQIFISLDVEAQEDRYRLEVPDELTPEKAETRLGASESAVKSMIHRFRQRHRELVREEIAHTVPTVAEIDEELRHLVSVLRG